MRAVICLCVTKSEKDFSWPFDMAKTSKSSLVCVFSEKDCQILVVAVISLIGKARKNKLQKIQTRFWLQNLFDPIMLEIIIRHSYSVLEVSSFLSKFWRDQLQNLSCIWRLSMHTVWFCRGKKNRFTAHSDAIWQYFVHWHSHNLLTE